MTKTHNGDCTFEILRYDVWRRVKIRVIYLNPNRSIWAGDISVASVDFLLCF